MDRLVVGVVLGPAAVSLVEIATQVQSGADAVLSASAYAVLPAAAWLSAREDRQTLRELVHRGTKYSLLATVPVATAAAILAGPAIRLWVGTQYQDAAGLAAVALASIVITAPLVVGSNVLVGVGRAADILLPAGMTIALNLALSIVLVHVVGIVGPFQATVVACAVQAPLLLRPLLRVTGSHVSDFVRDAVWPVVLPTAALACAAGLAVLLPLPDLVTLVAGGVAALAAYLAVALRFSVDRSELGELRNLSRRRNADES
jgi:O-antigen/teichoic acid export membrane protein